MRVNLILLLGLLSLLATFSSGFAQSEGCSFTKGQTIPYHQAKMCLLQIPFSRANAIATLDTISKAMQMYSFLDIAAQSPSSQLPSNVNFMEALGQIRSNLSLMNTAYQFEQSLADLFNSMKDAHTSYTKPLSFSVFTFMLPVKLGSVLRNGEQIIIINDPNSPYFGLKVSTINGRNAMSEMTSIAESICRDSMDLGTRFNDAMNRFSSRPQTKYAIPEQETVRMELEKGVHAVYTWQAFASQDIKNFQDLVNLYWALPTPIRNGSIPYIDAQDGKAVTPLARYMRDLHLERASSLTSFSQRFSKNNDDQLNRIYTGTNLAFSTIQPGVGVLRVPSFFPSEFGLDTITSIKSIPQFLFELQRVYTLAYNMKIKDMIIDLRGNGGGWACLGVQFARILFPSSPVAQTEEFDLRNCPLTSALANAASRLPKDVYSIFSPWKYSNPATYEPYTNSSWLIPGKRYHRGGTLASFSNIVTNDCSMLDIPDWDPKYLFKPNNALILTDGTCGSACALAARNIQENAKARTITVGGLQGRPQMIASFIGGLVYDLPTLLEELKLNNLLDSPDAPKPLTTSSGLRFTLWESYPWVGRSNPPIPAEYVFQPSDYRMLYSMESINSDSALYSEAYQVWKSA